MALATEVGIAEGMTMLVLSGSVGVKGVGVVRLVVGSVMLFGNSHAVYAIISPVLHQQRQLLTHLVRINLELHTQYRVCNIVHQIRCPHYSSTAAKAPSSIRILGVADRVRCRVDDGAEVDEVLDCGCGESDGGEDDTGDEHGGEQGVAQGHNKVVMRLANVEVARPGVESC